MIPDLDLYRAANVLVKQHGEYAPIHAAMRADAMLEKGDFRGWSRQRGTGYQRLPREASGAVSDRDAALGGRSRSGAPGLQNFEIAVSLAVMNSTSAGTPSRVLSIPRRIAGTISARSVTRSPWPPKARAMAA